MSFIFERIKDEDKPEILKIFKDNGYGEEEMDDWLNSKESDVEDQIPELARFLSDKEADDIADNMTEKEDLHFLDSLKPLKGDHDERIRNAHLDALKDQIEEQGEGDETILHIIEALRPKYRN